MKKKFSKEKGNDVAADVVWCERNNIICYASAFSII